MAPLDLPYLGVFKGMTNLIKNYDHVFVYCGVWLALPLRIFFRLLCAFFLWSICQASLWQSCHLVSEKTTSLMTDASCHHHFNIYSSGGEFKWQLTKIMLPQLSSLGSPLHLLNAKTLSMLQANHSHWLMRDHWSVKTFHALWFSGTLHSLSTYMGLID